jgi:hypothetical protein
MEIPTKCPKCGETNIIQIFYGIPCSEIGEKAYGGEIILGGCCVDPDNPNWNCKKCKFEFK